MLVRLKGYVPDADGMAQDEELTSLRTALRDAAVDELEWDPVTAGRLADVAIRRWRSFERRSKPNKRTAELQLRDLLQGLRQGSPIDPLFVGPRDFERLTPRFGELLSRADPVPDLEPRPRDPRN
jgi:hypothetical protein